MPASSPMIAAPPVLVEKPPLVTLPGFLGREVERSAKVWVGRVESFSALPGSRAVGNGERTARLPLSSKEKGRD